MKSNPRQQLEKGHWHHTLPKPRPHGGSTPKPWDRAFQGSGLENRGERWWLPILSFSLCPSAPDADPLLLFKNCAEGAQGDCSGWTGFQQVVLPNAHLCLPEKPCETQATPFHPQDPCTCCSVTDHPVTTPLSIIPGELFLMTRILPHAQQGKAAH